MKPLFSEIIRKKRNKNKLDKQDIYDFITGITDNSVSEGQAGAFAMSVFLNGMATDEIVNLTMAMRDSGITLKWDDMPGPIVDKHSTGGVGDTVSLMLGPMVAACGGFVPMISGRGLGHTGGTLDKFDSIPGYNTSPDIALFYKVVRAAGVAIIGQTSDLAPADKRLYAIRDVTATVESIPLITASILSKKLAAGLGALVMDVKVGTGAFMPTYELSQELAKSIVNVANAAGVRTTALLTDMNEPLAPCAGNAIEIQCAIDYLTGSHRPRRLHEVVMALSAQMLVLANLADDIAAARQKLQAALSDGSAAERFALMVSQLGGPKDILSRSRQYLTKAPIIMPVKATRAGIINNINTRQLGLAVVSLGGGRNNPSDKIDHAVGLEKLAGIGDSVCAGDTLCFVHARSQNGADMASLTIQSAFSIGDQPPPAREIIYSTIER